jgi:hypothetical protein
MHARKPSLLYCRTGFNVYGAEPQAGFYWFDQDGNIGIKGLPIPLANLYIAAHNNAFTGGSGGGDNIWSSRFCAGNYDSGNDRGYVSVPGCGPVGYGFQLHPFKK